MCPPGLHISVGIFQRLRLFDLLEEEFHKLDCHNASTCEDEQTGPTSFDSHVNETLQICYLEREQTQLTQQVTWLEQTAACMSLTTSSSTDGSGPLQIVRDEVVKTRAQLREIVSTLIMQPCNWLSKPHVSYLQEQRLSQHQQAAVKTFHVQEGPFVRSLDNALASFHVEHQAYHGGSFIGNHVHRCQKVKNLIL